MIGAPGFKETVAAAGLRLLEGEAARERRRGARLRPSRVRLRGAADRDLGAAGRRRAVRDQPRPDPADAGRRLARNRRDPGGGRDGLGQTRRDRRQAGAPPVRAGAGADRRAPSGWRWSATGSPPTSRAGGGPAWRRSSSSAAPASREEAAAADPPPDLVLDDLAALLRVSAMARARSPARSIHRPGARLCRRLRA